MEEEVKKMLATPEMNERTEEFEKKLKALREDGLAIPYYLPLVYASQIIGIPKKDVVKYCEENNIRTKLEKGDVADRYYVYTVDLMYMPSFDEYVKERRQLQEQTDVIQAFFRAINKIKLEGEE